LIRRRVLVTGAAGFIGQRLVRALVNVGASVAAISESRCDVRDAEAVRDAVAEADPEDVFHLAAVGVADSHVDPALALAVSAGGTLNLLEALREREIHRVVLVGTCYEYGARETTEGLDPFNAYAASKVAAWAFGRMYWRVYGTPIVVVRPFQVYGPGQPLHTLVPAAVRAALLGDDFPMTAGEQARDFIYVDDVVDGMLAAAAASGLEGHSLDLGTVRVHTVRDAVARVWHLTNARWRMQPGALPYRPGEVMRLSADAERTAHLTGWRARVELADGLARTIDWMRGERHV
jgi:nucleoside-diphosphate-sugar epimerase